MDTARCDLKITKAASFASLTATSIFVLFLVALHIVSRSTDPILYGISYYAFGNFGYLIGIALISAGIAGILLGIAQWPGTFSSMGRAGIILLLIWGSLSVFAGLFPLDPPNSPSTVSGVIHNIAGRNVILIVPGVFFIELAARSNLSLYNQKRRLALAWFLLVATVLMFLFNAPYAHLGMGGAFQRLYWFVLTLWLMIASYQQLRQPTHP